MTNTTGRPEWLRPIDERYLADDLGPAPGTVHAAIVGATLCAVAAAGMAVAYGRLTIEHAGLENLVLTLVGAALLVIFAAATFMFRRRGWFRLPLLAAVSLGVLATVALLLLASPGPTAEAQYGEPRLLATGAVAFGLAVLLRTPSASTWLAKRRYQVKHR